jgi:hypothetical protein
MCLTPWRGRGLRAPVALLISCVLSYQLVNPLITAQPARAELTAQDFRGSSLTYSNTVSLLSLKEDAEPTYNPYYDMLLTLAPRYWFAQRAFVSARVSFDRELTQADDNTYKNQTLLSDTNLGVGAILHSWDFGLTTFGSLGLRLPTSLASQARTMQAGMSSMVALTQALGEIGSLSYSFGLGYTAFKYTTGETESPRISSCRSAQLGCDPFLSDGVRNAPWNMTHGLSLSVFPTSWLFVSASAAWIDNRLYPRTIDDSLVSYVPQEPTNQRVAMNYSLEVDIQPEPWLIVALILDTFHPQRAPDASLYRPFFNRFTTASVDLRFTLGVFRVAQTASAGTSSGASAPQALPKKQVKPASTQVKPASAPVKPEDDKKGP